MRWSATGRLIRTTIENWDRDRAPRHAAALAFYTAFSIAPMLVIAIALAGLVFGRDVAQKEVMNQISALIGSEATEAIRGILRNAYHSGASVPAAIAGLVALIFGASGAFGQLQDSLNTIWKAPGRKRKGLWRVIRARFMTFAAVVGLGFLLLVSLVASAALEAMGRMLTSQSIGTIALMKGLNLLVSFGGIMALFMVMFKVLPETQVRWRDLWFGAALTAALFTVGKYLIGVYLGNAAIGSSYGAASSFILILLWIYYSSQIVLLGAEFTKAYSDARGPTISPPLYAPSRNRGHGVPRRVEARGRSTSPPRRRGGNPSTRSMVRLRSPRARSG